MKKSLILLFISHLFLASYTQVDTISNNIYQFNGRLGIGTTNPDALLKITGDVSDGNDRALIRLRNLDNGPKSSVSIALNSWDETAGAAFGWTNENFASIPDFNNMGVFSTNRNGFAMYSTSDYGSIRFYTNMDHNGIVERMRINAEGQVGIGTAEPLNKFQVNDEGTRVQIGYQPAYKGPYINIYGTDVGAAPMLALGVARDVYFKFNDTLAMKDWGLIYGNDLNEGIAFASSLSYPDKGMFLHKDGKLGIGVRHPMTRLDVEGGIKLGFTETEAGGVLRWTGEDLEVHTGSSWSSLLTQSESQWTTQEEGISYADGNVGIGTEAPKAKLQVTDGDVYISNIERGIIMKSPNGQCWRGQVDNNGTLSFSPVPCPETPVFSEQLVMEAERKVRIYPNPTSHSLTIRISDLPVNWLQEGLIRKVQALTWKASMEMPSSCR